MPTGLENLLIRPVREKDNQAMAAIIRNTLTEFGAARPGTVYYDETTDALFHLFSTTPDSFYYVAEQDGALLGGGGIFPSAGLPPGTCELVKMYLLPQARGLGLGRKLMERCMTKAKENGYKNIYIETMPELSQALKMYEKFGFRYLKGPLGNTGHHGCGLWMLLSLEP